jgi:peptidoglycan/xylan/chitin deacetylase (PgdA/CDA1 family)
MAYMNQQKKAALAPAIKAVLKKYNMKGTIAVPL